MTIGSRIRNLRENKKVTQSALASFLGLSPSTIGMYEQDRRKPDYETLEAIADYFNVNLDYLIKSTPYEKKTKFTVPVLGKVTAGIPIDAVEYIVDYEEISEEMASKGDYFGLQIKGDSMEPKFSEGDVVIVRKQSTIQSGEIAIVLINGDEATIKKVMLFEGGLNLVPSNQAYQVITFTNEQIEKLPVQILGKVVELRAKF